MVERLCKHCGRKFLVDNNYYKYCDNSECVAERRKTGNTRYRQRQGFIDLSVISNQNSISEDVRQARLYGYTYGEYQHLKKVGKL